MRVSSPSQNRPLGLGIFAHLLIHNGKSGKYNPFDIPKSREQSSEHSGIRSRSLPNCNKSKLWLENIYCVIILHLLYLESLNLCCLDAEEGVYRLAVVK